MIRAYINYIITRIKDALVGPFTEMQGDKDYDRLYQEELARQTKNQEEDAAEIDRLIAENFPPKPSLTLPAVMPEEPEFPAPIPLEFPKQIPTSDKMIEERKAKRNTTTTLCSTSFTVMRRWKSALKAHPLWRELPDGDPNKLHRVTITVEEIAIK